MFTGHLKGSSVFFQPLPVSSGSFSRSSKGFSRSGLGTGSESHSESIHPHNVLVVVSNLLPMICINRYHVVSCESQHCTSTFTFTVSIVHIQLLSPEALRIRFYFQDVSLPEARPRHEPDRFRFPDFL